MDVNLTVRVPGLEILVNYAASGIGAVAGPMLAPWRASREAKARLISAHAEAETVRIIADEQAAAQRSFVSASGVQGALEINPEGITQRIEYQERKRQANIYSVVREAARELGDKEVPQHEPDHDWAARFFASSQDVSSEDMRSIWARILAGEVQKPGITSLRTLATLRNLSSGETKTFSRISRYRIGNFIYPHPETKYDGYTLPLMEEVGLIRSAREDRNSIGVVSKPEVIHREPGYILVVEAESPARTHLSGGHVLTRPGKEILQCIEPEPDMQYLGWIAHSLQKSGLTLKITTEVSCDSRGELNYNPDDLRIIEPVSP